MHVTGFGATDIGSSREDNQDAFIVDNELGLYVVCDGMGGHAGGKTAAWMAAEGVEEFLRTEFGSAGAWGSSAPSSEDYVRVVRNAVQEVCARVYRRARSDEACHGMGTTLTMLFFADGKAFVGHVGDSRAYLCRQNKFYRLTRDHTLVQDMLDRGCLTQEEAARSPFAHVLSRAVGLQESVQVDTLQVEVIPGDRFLVCTDGLSGIAASADEFCESFEQEEPEAVCQRLIAYALSRGSSDNITALVISSGVKEEERSKWAEKAGETALKLETLSGVPLFSGLELHELAKIVERARFTRIKKGQVLFSEGDWGDGMYVILEGTLGVTREGKKLAEFGRGNHVGEMSLFDPRPRSATVTAEEDAKILKIERTDFLSLIKEEPVMGVNLLTELLRELCRRLDTAVEYVIQVTDDR